MTPLSVLVATDTGLCPQGIYGELEAEDMWPSSATTAPASSARRSP